MLELIFILPIVTGIIALLVPANLGRGMLFIAALFHLQLTAMAGLGRLPMLTADYFAAIEATTLVSAPLIFIHRSRETLEATWK